MCETGRPQIVVFVTVWPLAVYSLGCIHQQMEYMCWKTEYMGQKMCGQLQKRSFRLSYTQMGYGSGARKQCFWSEQNQEQYHQQIQKKVEAYQGCGPDKKHSER
jgi:hypothetical protein